MIGCALLVGQVAKLQKEYYNTPGKYYLADVATKEAKKAKKAKKDKIR
jgi:AGCS family alanine or glycine:cation symporter